MNKGDSTMFFWWCIGVVLLENTLAFVVWNHLDGMKCWCNGAAIFCMIRPCSLWSCSGQTIGVRWNYGLWFACWWTIWTMSTTYVCNVLTFACWRMNNLRILYFWTAFIHPSLTHSFIDSSIQTQWHTHIHRTLLLHNCIQGKEDGNKDQLVNPSELLHNPILHYSSTILDESHWRGNWVERLLSGGGTSVLSIYWSHLGRVFGSKGPSDWCQSNIR